MTTTPRIFYLSTCSTCQRILKEWNPGAGIVLQEIKNEPLTAEQVDTLQELAGSYEALFSRVARKYREMGLHEKKLSEPDFRKYLLQEYTFLKRPVLVLGKQVFIGNQAKVVAAAKAALKDR